MPIRTGLDERIDKVRADLSEYFDEAKMAYSEAIKAFTKLDSQVYKEVKQIRPAHFVTVSIAQGKVEETRYRTLTHNSKLPDVCEGVAEKMVEEILTKAILKRTVADVPIACFLSGGVDSGLIVALLAKNSSKPVNTFSVGFGEEEYNELPYAKKLAEMYGTNHTELIVEPDITDIVDDVASLKVIGAVHHQVGASQQIFGVFSVQISDQASDLYLAVDAAQFALGSNGLW